MQISGQGRKQNVMNDEEGFLLGKLKKLYPDIDANIEALMRNRFLKRKLCFE